MRIKIGEIMELNPDQGFIIQNGGDGKTEILINPTHLRGVFVGVRSTIRLGNMFMPENFDPYLCMLATLKYLLPEFANVLIMKLKNKTHKIGLGIIEAIESDSIIRVMKEKIPNFGKMARIQCSTIITNPLTAEKIKVNIYVIVGGRNPLGYVYVDPNEFKQTSINIIKNHLALVGG
jgi:hypothetical protein